MMKILEEKNCKTLDSEHSNVSGVSSSYLINPAFQNYTAMDTKEKGIAITQLKLKKIDDLMHPKNHLKTIKYLNRREREGDFFSKDEKVKIYPVYDENRKTRVLIFSQSNLHVYINRSGLVLETRHEKLIHYIINYKNGTPIINVDFLDYIFEVASEGKVILEQMESN
ncbi:MAG: hypothetical protein ACOCWW_04615 [Bacteroidota bacterium]